MRCMRFTFITGRRVLMGAVSASTDDKGEYRAYGLQPGRYYVTAVYRWVSPFDTMEIQGVSSNEEYAPLFYPGTVSLSNAIPVEVSPGREASGIDIKLARLRTFRVSGRLAGGMVNGPAITLMPRD